MTQSTALLFYLFIQFMIFVPMKYLFFFLLIGFIAIACKQKPKAEADTQPTITSTTSSGSDEAVDTLKTAPGLQTETPPTPGNSPAIDSIGTTPPNPDAKGDVGPGGKKYEAPKTKPNITAHECNPNFNQIAKPQGNKHFYYVSGFDIKEFECWILLEKHGVSICNNQACTIYYIDSPNVRVGSGANPIDAATLKSHGIGLFSHDGSFWEMKGANIWKRTPGYGYYNTNNHLGG